MAHCDHTSLADHHTIGLIKHTTHWMSNVVEKIKSKLETRRMNVERRDAFKMLHRLDNRQLKDIGVTRGDITWASNLPLEVNASAELQKLRSRGFL